MNLSAGSCCTSCQRDFLRYATTGYFPAVAGNKTLIRRGNCSVKKPKIKRQKPWKTAPVFGKSKIPYGVKSLNVSKTYGNPTVRYVKKGGFILPGLCAKHRKIPTDKVRIKRSLKNYQNLVNS